MILKRIVQHPFLRKPQQKSDRRRLSYKRSFLRQGETGAIVVLEADVDRYHVRAKRSADTDDGKVFAVHLT